MKTDLPPDISRPLAPDVPHQVPNGLNGAASVAPSRLTRKDITRAIRTRQWAKNALLLAGFLFAGRLREPLAVAGPEALRVFLGVLCFCALSASTYLINDWSDIERDRLHPVKKNRPLASGRMSLSVARNLIVICLLLALVSSFVIVRLAPEAWLFCLAALFYFCLTLAYSFRLKHEVIIDVLSVAFGFVVRVVAGCVVIPVRISPWIIFCTFTLALFIALCKRRAEFLQMGESAHSTRHVLTHYTLSMLDTFIAIAAGLTITSYSLYTFSATESTGLQSVVKHSPLLMLTIPFIVYGVFRYLLLAHSSHVGGEPEQMLRDKRLMINAILWALLVAVLTIWKF